MLRQLTQTMFAATALSARVMAKSIPMPVATALWAHETTNRRPPKWASRNEVVLAAPFAFVASRRWGVLAGAAASAIALCALSWLVLGKDAWVGFIHVKGLELAAIEGLLADRERRGPYTSLVDFIERTAIELDDLKYLSPYILIASWRHSPRLVHAEFGTHFVRHHKLDPVLVAGECLPHLSDRLLLPRCKAQQLCRGEKKVDDGS